MSWNVWKFGLWDNILAVSTSNSFNLTEWHVLEQISTGHVASHGFFDRHSSAQIEAMHLLVCSFDLLAHRCSLLLHFTLVQHYVCWLVYRNLQLRQSVLAVSLSRTSLWTLLNRSNNIIVVSAHLDSGWRLNASVTNDSRILSYFWESSIGQAGQSFAVWRSLERNFICLLVKTHKRLGLLKCSPQSWVIRLAATCNETALIDVLLFNLMAHDLIDQAFGVCMAVLRINTLALRKNSTEFVS